MQFQKYFFLSDQAEGPRRGPLQGEGRDAQHGGVGVRAGGRHLRLRPEEGQAGEVDQVGKEAVVEAEGARNYL